MKYFNIYKYKDCIEKLVDGYDAVGINFHLTPNYHFSGNFWWTSYSHIRNLERLVYDDYLSTEMWVCSNSTGRYYCSFHSRVDHYQQRYDEKHYIDPPIEVVSDHELATVNNPPYKLYVYLHVCCINNWKEVVGDIFSDIKHSGLYDKITEIRCYVLSHNLEADLTFFNDKKIKIIGAATDLGLYEVCTINKLHSDALLDDMKSENTYVLYLHSKGVTKPDNNSVKGWVKFMKHFNIYRHQYCINKLIDGCDAVGVNLAEGNSHFSGNFWWSSYEHIRKLKKCGYSFYTEPEFWICTREGRYTSLFQYYIHPYEGDFDEKYYNPYG